MQPQRGHYYEQVYQSCFSLPEDDFPTLDYFKWPVNPGHNIIKNMRFAIPDYTPTPVHIDKKHYKGLDIKEGEV